MTLVGLSHDSVEAPYEAQEEEKKEEHKENSVLDGKQKCPFDYFANRQRHLVERMKKTHSVKKWDLT